MKCSMHLFLSLSDSCTLRCVRNVAFFFFNPQCFTSKPALHHHHYIRNLISFNPLLRLCEVWVGSTRVYAQFQGTQRGGEASA